MNMANSRVGLIALRTLVFLGLLAAWEGYASRVSKTLLPSPSEIFSAAVELFRDGIIPEAFLVTMGPFVLGFVLAVVAGVTIGMLMGSIKGVHNVLDPWVSFLYALPSIALFPLFVIWMGVGVEIRIFLVFFSGIFPMIIHAVAGFRNTDKELIKTAQSFCATKRQIARTVVLPAAMPFIFAGVRVALVTCFIAIIAGEMILLSTGLGGLIRANSNLFATANIFVSVLTIMAISVTLLSIARRLHKRLTPWDTSWTDEGVG